MDQVNQQAVALCVEARTFLRGHRVRGGGGLGSRATLRAASISQTVRP